MGNCLSFQHKAKETIKIMTVDGKVLAYRSPLKVHEALSEFPDHAISESLPVVQHLEREADMLGGNLYYLLPPKAQAVTEAKNDQGTSIVRIKLVVSKQELKEMLMSKDGVSLLEMISELQSRPGPPVQAAAGRGDSDCRYRSWKPALESIPETNDLC